MGQRISVIIATRNSERYLRQALDSVYANGHEQLDVILVDGHSTDATESIAQEYSKIRFVRQQGHGLYAAWNQGIALARGDYIAFLDSDDYWSEKRLDIGLKHLLANPEEDFVLGHVRFFLEPGFSVPLGFKTELFEAPQPGRIPGTLLARRPSFDRVGSFDEHLHIAADVDWFARAKDLGVGGSMLKDTLLHKRIHDSNLSNYAAKNQSELLRVLARSVKRQRPKQ